MNLDITSMELYQKCLDEVNDPNYSYSRHGMHGTYTDGCRGPMCSYSRSTARTRGPSYLSNDLIEYLSVYMWLDAHARRGEMCTIYEAHKNLRTYYARLASKSLASGLENNLAQWSEHNPPATHDTNPDTALSAKSAKPLRRAG